MGLIRIDSDTQLCPNFIYQNDRNGHLAIYYCAKLGEDSSKDHEGNCGCYPCPCGEVPQIVRLQEETQRLSTAHE